MGSPALPTNNEGRAHHLGKKLVGGTGPQMRKCYKKKANRQECNQKVLTSKGHYSLKSRVGKERSEVRNRKNCQSRVSGRQRKMGAPEAHAEKEKPPGEGDPGNFEAFN
jgi:hypothetical protein